MSLEAILQTGMLVQIEVIGEERFYLPPLEEGERAWPLLGLPWRSALAQIRFQARAGLETLGIPGVFPGTTAVWVPPPALPGVEILAARLERRLRALRERMRNDYDQIAQEAWRAVERAARARRRRHALWARDRTALLNWHYRMFQAVFPRFEELRSVPGLQVIRQPVPAAWIPQARTEAVRRWVEGLFRHILYRLYPALAASRPLHPRVKGELGERLDRIPADLLALFPDLERAAGQIRDLLSRIPARSRRRRRLFPNGDQLILLEQTVDLLVRVLAPPPEAPFPSGERPAEGEGGIGRREAVKPA